MTHHMSAVPVQPTGYCSLRADRKLTPGVGHAADFGDALLEAGLVAREVFAYQLAIPLTKEVARMFAHGWG